MSRIDQARPTRSPHVATRPRPPLPRLRHVRVADSVLLSPNVQRVTLTGHDLSGFRLGRPGAHVKLLLPPAGHVTVPIPTRPPTAVSAGQVVGDELAPIVRSYTPRSFDPERRELAIDVALHGEGAGSCWSQLARVGDRAAIAGPGGGYDPDPDADWFVLAGDESAMPALLAIAAALPPTTHARVFLEVPTMRDAQQVPSAADLDVRVLPRRDMPAGHLLEPAVRATTLPPGDGRAWLAGEADLVRRLRDHLLGAGLARDDLVGHGYWKRGTVNHPDDDHGRD